MTKPLTHVALQRLHVTCGPTISTSEVHAVCPEAIVHPPIQHGDLYRIGLEPGDRILIIDGLFHQTAPIRHKEILDMIAQGVQVVGSSSMGALRAAELHTHGMHGVGRIFELFAGGAIDNDDAVAVVHLESDDEFRALSEPLVNFRFALEDAALAGVIDHRSAAAILELIQDLDYPGRTWRNVYRLLEREGRRELAGQYTAVTTWLAEHPASANTKKADALHALDELTRESHSTTVPVNDRWATSFVHGWRNRFRPLTTQPDETLTVLAGLHYCQLYDGEFLPLWRKVVLAHIAGATTTDLPDDELLGAADAEIVRHGICLSDLTPQQRSQWLTPDEQSSLDTETQLRLLVIRSAPLTPSQMDLSSPLATVLLDLAHRGAAEARAVQQISTSLLPAGLTVDHISDQHLVTSLDNEWSLATPTPQHRDIAARQRGFLSFEHAKDASRHFIPGRLRRVRKVFPTSSSSVLSP
ncbi:hypothetical protein HLB23_02465 [Nocardia uniformis]|uniref:TfuA-like core domain-containing protein n=1 Tax=Nocardia uniformis TaxID=53432 RepID=A0A849BPX1_9NOCA|nr:TfuA-like protein [Nocardia uniformis]NNH68752.1 hypothetical protein [Nocardia uniformis]